MKLRNQTHRPRIGLTIGTKIPRRLASIDYRKAVWESGGMPVMIGRSDVGKALECDGLILSGGWDIDPSLYPRRPEDEAISDGELIHRYVVRPELKRDLYELPLARQALESDIPVLGICRGIQVLNVAEGGGLIPHIPAWSDSVRHRFRTGEKHPLHLVDVTSNSDFAAVMGSGAMEVNSYHHQGLTDKELSPMFRAVAYSSDGLVEAFEKPGHRYFLAVQWHPERFRDAGIRDRFKPLVDELVSSARNR